MLDLQWDGLLVDELASGACTDYEQPGTIYANTYVHFTRAGVEYRRQPIDHVGEEPLGDGYWSFQIWIPDLARPYADVAIVRDN